MYRNSSDNLGDSEMSPVARLFFSFPAQIQVKASGLRTEETQWSTQAMYVDD